MWLNYSDISFPKRYPAPRGDMPQPEVMESGSDHRRSHMGPSWGTSWILSNCRILSRVSREGERPPWRENIFKLKIILLFLQPKQWGVGSRRRLWSTSRRLSSHIFLRIRRKNHKLGWWFCFHGFLEWGLFYRDIWLSGQARG